MLSSPWKDVNSVLNKIGRQRGEGGSVIEVYENRRPRIKPLADYQDDGQSDTAHENSDFQWKERPIAYRKVPAKQNDV